jgi:hypothetical protein
MRTLTLNDNEQTLIIELLEIQLKELSHEIHQTDKHAYRDSLEEKRVALEQLLKRLKETEHA